VIHCSQTNKTKQNKTKQNKTTQIIIKKIKKCHHAAVVVAAAEAADHDNGS
jgi:hypothetical protein